MNRQISEKPLDLVAETYFKLGAKLELHWFLDQITGQPVGNHWQALARAAFKMQVDYVSGPIFGTLQPVPAKPFSLPK